MKSAINTLDQRIRSLKAEKRIFSKAPNFNPDTVEEIVIEIKDHQKALKILKKQL